MQEPALRLRGVSKYYKVYEHESDRLREILSGRPRFRQLDSLQALDLEVGRGEVLGVVGKNGAGKSTLLKILAGTLQPSAGQVEVRGRVAALLELGGSFHPELSGHDNIYLNGAILGLKKAEIDLVYDSIVEFSGVREFIDRPVKTYSSGMFVRLAFSVATHIDPDILIIDEALSVGDGVFARKSFDRIMDFKQQGKTILFCSHSLYQIEAICDRVLWLDKGRLMALGKPAEVVTRYGETLRREAPRQEHLHQQPPDEPGQASQGASPRGHAAPGAPLEMPRILGVDVRANGELSRSLLVNSGETDLDIEVRFSAPPHLPLPSVGLAFTDGDGRILSSAGSVNDGLQLRRVDGHEGRAAIRFPRFPLLKGRYNLDVYLMCEKGLHTYEAVVQAAELNVQQKGLARGLVDLPHEWQA